MLIRISAYCSYLSFLLFPLLCMVSTDLGHKEDDIRMMQVPVLKVNFYLMGHEEENEDVFLQIGSNIDHINNEFEGMIGFELHDLFTDETQEAWLPDLYEDIYMYQGKETFGLVSEVEQSNGINVFVFPTYCKEGTDKALMGFTPILKAQQEKYKTASPNFDRIFISYEGLQNETTLIHEMGHFLGLKHPWEMSRSTKYTMGLRTNYGITRNHMSYGTEVQEFTLEQLRSMQSYALRYRRYLASKIINIRP